MKKEEQNWLNNMLFFSFKISAEFEAAKKEINKPSRKLLKSRVEFNTVLWC